MANVATTGNTDIDDEFEALVIPEDASIDERLRILMINSDNYQKHLATSIARTEQRLRDYDQRIARRAREAREQSQEFLASSCKEAIAEFATLSKEDSILATLVSSHQSELESQESARKEFVSEVELPIGGDKPTRLTGELQPYIEVVHGEEDQQDCSSDNTIVSEQISDFSTNQAKYVATYQMHGGQDMAHDHPFDQKKQVHDHFNCDSATGRLGEGDQNQSQLNYQLSCGLQKPICGFINQFNLKFFKYASRPGGGFDICGGHIYNPRSSEALDVENSDQQVVVYNGQSVANPEDTMFYDMVVGDKADLGTSSSPKVQLKIMFRQPTRILGGQDYPSHEPNSFKFINTKYLCFFPTSSHKGGFHAINLYASELGVKHRWPPPWPFGG